jgi:hypothetical protein
MPTPTTEPERKLRLVCSVLTVPRSCTWRGLLTNSVGEAPVSRGERGNGSSAQVKPVDNLGVPKSSCKQDTAMVSRRNISPLFAPVTVPGAVQLVQSRGGTLPCRSSQSRIDSGSYMGTAPRRTGYHHKASRLAPSPQKRELLPVDLGSQNGEEKNSLVLWARQPSCGSKCRCVMSSR